MQPMPFAAPLKCSAKAKRRRLAKVTQAEVEVAVLKLRQGYHAESTMASRHSAVNSYEDFCENKGLTPWPITLVVMEKWIAALRWSHYTAIPAYITSVKVENELRGHELMQGRDLKMLHRARKASRRAVGASDRSAPIWEAVVKKLWLHRGLDTAAVCIMVLTFYLLLRVGGAARLRPKDFKFEDGKVIVTIREWKNDPEQKEVHRTLSCKGDGRKLCHGSKACPVCAAKRLVRMNVDSSRSYVEAAMGTSVQVPARCAWLEEKVRVLLQASGMTPKRLACGRHDVSWHGFRRGGAQCLYWSDFDRVFIRIWGRWKVDGSLDAYIEEAPLAKKQMNDFREVLSHTSEADMMGTDGS